MTEKYKWLGTSDLTIPETEKSVRTGQEFELGHNELSYNGIQVMIDGGLLVKVTGVRPVETEAIVEAKVEKKYVTTKGVKPFI